MSSHFDKERGVKAVCETCMGRLHPQGCACPYGAHVLAGRGSPCQSLIHGLTSLYLVEQQYFPERSHPA